MAEPNKRDHIEFLGMMGSGKTTYTGIMNNLLYQKLGYYPGPQSSYLSIQSDLNFYPKILAFLPQSILYRLPDFVVQKLIRREYHWQEFSRKNKVLVESLQKLIRENDLKNRYNSEEFEYFTVLSFYYQAMAMHRKQSCFLIDEGFLKVIRHFIVDGNCQVNESNQYLLDLIPKVSVIVNCVISPELALSRMGQRKAGVPHFLKQFGEDEKIRVLEVIEGMDRHIIDLMKSRGVKVLEINSENSIQYNTNKIKSFVDLEIV